VILRILAPSAPRPPDWNSRLPFHNQLNCDKKRRNKQDCIERSRSKLSLIKFFNRNKEKHKKGDTRDNPAHRRTNAVRDVGIRHKRCVSQCRGKRLYASLDDDSERKIEEFP
jgi:hypothetical protein